MMTEWLVYQGEREGVFSLNSRAREGEKYRVTYNHPFEVDRNDLWIASIPGYRVLSLVDFVPTTVRVENPDESYLTRWEGAFIEGLAGSLPNPARVVEVGTGKGISLARILIGLAHHTDIMVWSVDLLDCEDAREYVQKWQIPNWRYKLLIGNSAEIGKGWRESLDLVYLDGSHTYGGVMADVEAWSPHIKGDGILAFHDYGNRKHETTRAVQKSTEGWKRIGRVGYLIAFERK